MVKFICPRCGDMNTFFIGGRGVNGQRRGCKGCEASWTIPDIEYTDRTIQVFPK